MSIEFKKITPVNGFDSTNPDNARQNNYAWSMAEMGDYIYVGTGRNIVYSVLRSGVFPDIKIPAEFTPKQVDMGAEIWRYKKDGSEGWRRVHEESAQSGVIGFRFMIRYTTPQGETALYAGCYTVQSGITLLKSTNGTTWEKLITSIPGTSTRAMIEHNRKLYMGVLEENSDNTSLYVSEDPQRSGWRKIETNTVGIPEKNPRGAIVTMVSFNGHIYLGTSPVGGFEVWRTMGDEPRLNDWKLVVDKGAGDALNEIPLTMGVFKNELYVGTAIMFAIVGTDPERRLVPPKPFDLIRINRCDEWQVVVGGEPVLPTNPVTGRRKQGRYESGFGDISNGYCWQLVQYEDKFYLGTWDWSDLLIPLIRANHGNSVELNTLLTAAEDPAAVLGFIKEYNLKPLTSMLRGSLLHFWDQMGFDLYVSDDGRYWEPVTLNGLGNPQNYGLRNLMVSGRKLYLGTANPFKGCEVWVSQ